jgi:Sulfotransferase family
MMTHQDERNWVIVELRMVLRLSLLRLCLVVGVGIAFGCIASSVVLVQPSLDITEIPPYPEEPSPLLKGGQPTQKEVATSATNLLHAHKPNNASLSIKSLLPPQPLAKPVRLLRIPKAGSSSFSAFLRLQYNCTSEEHPPGDCVKKNRLLCMEIEGCSNHKGPPDWKNQENVRPMITFIREPFARYVSAYNYPGHHGLGTGSNITKHTILWPEYDNSQTNYLSRNPIGTWHLTGNRRNKARTEPPEAKPSDEEWDRRLLEAVELLESDVLKFVGLLEYWNDSLRLFCRMYECTRIEDSLNAKPERQQSMEEMHNKLTASDVEAVTKSNAVDTRLYQVAVARFCRDLAKYKDDTAFVATLHEDTVQLCRSSLNTTLTQVQSKQTPKENEQQSWLE